MLEGGKKMFKRSINAFQCSWWENVSISRDHCTVTALHWYLRVVPEPQLNQVWTGQDRGGTESVSDRPGGQLVGFSADLRTDFTLEVQGCSRAPRRGRSRGCCRQNQPMKTQKTDGKRRRGVKCSQGSRLRLRVIKWCQELKRHTHIHTHTLPLSLITSLRSWYGISAGWHKMDGCH